MAATACFVVAQGAGAQVASTDDAQARAVLKAMSDYMGKQASIEVGVDTAVEIITPELEKLSFDSSSKVKMVRPNKFRFERTGGFVHVDVIFDGAALTERDLNGSAYAQVPVTGSVDEVLGMAADSFGVAAPGLDLMLADSYSVLIADVIEAKYLGTGVIDGKTCDHVAFRNTDVDWQLWVRQGADRIPCKMIITTKTMAQGPQFTTTIRSWKPNPVIPVSTFVFKPAAGERQLDVGQLSLDELPAPATGKAKN